MFKKVLSFIMAVCLFMTTFVFLPSAESDMLRSITDIDLASVSKVYFKGETNKDFTSYSVGEEMVFSMTMYADNEQITAPYFYYSVEGDDGSYAEGYIEGGTDRVEITASVSRPGAVLLNVIPCDASKQPVSDSKITPFSGGALAGAEDIKTTAAEPADFMDFWNKTLELLDAPKVDFIYSYEYSSGGVTYDAFELEINVPVDDYYKETYPQLWEKDGERHYVYAYIAVPQNAEAGSLPLDILFYGRDKMVPYLNVAPGKIMMSVGPHCVPASHNVKEGETSSNVSNGAYTNAYYEALHNEYSYRSNLGFDPSTNEKAETCYFKYMHLRNVQALRFAKECFGENGIEALSAYKGLWNGTDIKVSGQSQGGMQSLAVAALCPEVTEVSVTVPWFADVAGNTDSAKLQSTLRPEYKKGLSYMDSAIFAKHITAERVSIAAGTCDTLCPMSAVQAIYNNLNTNASIRFIQGMGHASTNTYRIESEKAKTYKDNIIEHTDYFYLEGASAEFIEAFDAAWKTINGRNAFFYTEESAFLSSSEESKHYLKISEFGAPLAASESVSDCMAELEAYVGDNGIDSYNTVFTASSELSSLDKAILELSSNESKTAFNLISIFETDTGSALAVKMATDISGVIFGNQISGGKKLTVIGEDGKAVSGVAVTENTDSFKAYPVIIPAYDLAQTDLSAEYSKSAEGYGIYKVSGDGIAAEIKVFSSEEVDVYGRDAGADYIISNAVLNIYGNGAVTDADYAWNEHISGVNEIIVNTGVTSIGANAFDVPSGASVKLPYTVLDIDSEAFCGKTDFSITGYMGSGAEELGADSFISLGSAGSCGKDVYFIYNNGTLEITGTGPTLESGIVSYGGKASCAWAAHYNDITKVIVGENITTLSSRSFHYMPALTTVEITENLKKLSGSAFEGGPALTTVYLKGNEPVTGTVDLSCVTSIGGNAFNDCKKIKKFILSDELEGEIGATTFQLCSSITELTIPAGVTQIRTAALGDASALRTLTVLGRNTVISADVFKSTWNTDLIKNVKIVAYSGSIAQGLAKSQGLVFENIETGKIVDYGASPAAFMVFEGYQIRTEDYNGLRSVFTINKNSIPTFENEGYELYGYGALMAAEDYLLQNEDELTLTLSEDGALSTLDYAILIPVYSEGRYVGRLVSNEADKTTFACTVINFNETNFDKAVSVRGYVLFKDPEGNISVHYVDYSNKEYSAVTLEQVCEGLLASGAITADAISYIHVQNFKKIRDDEFANDNEFDHDNFW